MLRGFTITKEGLRPASSQPRQPDRAPAPAAQPAQKPVPSTTVRLDLGSVVDAVGFFLRQREQSRRWDQELNLDILGLAKLMGGVLSAPDLMVHVGLSRRAAVKRLTKFTGLGYCRILNENEPELLYLFEALLPEPHDCEYCGHRYRKDRAPAECNCCGAPISRRC
ncbi:MAG: hypothetical protein KC910_13185 [Candidatus Eremiobacteraeota bacterium]|nr:hypothetical protein [Candidatus Eremiobacteraeota bacterium]